MTDLIQTALALWQEYQRRRIDDVFADPLRDPAFRARCEALTLTAPQAAEVFGFDRTLPAQETRRGNLAPLPRQGRVQRYAFVDLVRWRADQLSVPRPRAMTSVAYHIGAVGQGYAGRQADVARIMQAVSAWLEHPDTPLADAVAAALEE